MACLITFFFSNSELGKDILINTLLNILDSFISILEFKILFLFRLVSNCTIVLDELKLNHGDIVSSDILNMSEIELDKIDRYSETSLQSDISGIFSNTKERSSFDLIMLTCEFIDDIELLILFKFLRLSDNTLE